MAAGRLVALAREVAPALDPAALADYAGSLERHDPTDADRVARYLATMLLEEVAAHPNA